MRASPFPWTMSPPPKPWLSNSPASSTPSGGSESPVCPSVTLPAGCRACSLRLARPHGTHSHLSVTLHLQPLLLSPISPDRCLWRAACSGLWLFSNTRSVFSPGLALILFPAWELTYPYRPGKLLFILQGPGQMLPSVIPSS